MKIKKSLLLLPLFAMACRKANYPNPTVNDIIGVWSGHYCGGVETLKFESNGFVSQKFVATNGVTIYSNQAKWTVTNKIVLIEPFYFNMNLETIDKPTKIDSMNANWEGDPIRMEFGEWPYYIKKSK